MRINFNVLQPIVYIGLLNFVLIILMLVMATSIMATPAGVTLNITQPVINRDQSTIEIKITSENVIYVDSRVMTINELRRLLASPEVRGGLINIHADKRASMGRVMDVLGLCRGVMKGQVNVSALE